MALVNEANLISSVIIRLANEISRLELSHDESIKVAKALQLLCEKEMMIIEKFFSCEEIDVEAPTSPVEEHVDVVEEKEDINDEPTTPIIEEEKEPIIEQTNEVDKYAKTADVVIDNIEIIAKAIAKYKDVDPIISHLHKEHDIKIDKNTIVNIRAKRICADETDKYFTLINQAEKMKNKTGRPYVRSTDIVPVVQQLKDDTEDEVISDEEEKPQEKEHRCETVTHIVMGEPKRKNGYHPRPINRADSCIAQKQAMGMKLDAEDMEYLVKKASNEIKSLESYKLYNKLSQYNISATFIYNVLEGKQNVISDYELYKP